jgi:hypothetical protein
MNDDELYHQRMANGPKEWSEARKRAIKKLSEIKAKRTRLISKIAKHIMQKIEFEDHLFFEDLIKKLEKMNREKK